MKKVCVYIFAFMLIIISGCKKDLPLNGVKSVKKSSCHLKSGSANPNLVLYWGHEEFIRGWGPLCVTRQMTCPNNYLSYQFQQFTLKIHNGYGSNNRVSSGTIKIDGIKIVKPSDFGQNVDSIIKTIPSLNPNSILTVELNGPPCGRIDLWVDGILPPQ